MKSKEMKEALNKGDMQKIEVVEKRTSGYKYDNNCGNIDDTTGACKTGCPGAPVAVGGMCLWLDEDEEAKIGCPCYVERARGVEKEAQTGRSASLKAAAEKGDWDEIEESEKKAQFESVCQCNNFRVDTNQCKPGCPESRVVPGNVCPWASSDVEAKKKCKCYS